MSACILGLIISQVYWLFRDYRYYSSQPLFSTQFDYYLPRKSAVSLGRVPLDVIKEISNAGPASRQTWARRGIIMSAVSLKGSRAVPPRIIKAGTPLTKLSEVPLDDLLSYRPAAPTAYLLRKVKWQFGYSILLILFTGTCLAYMLRTIFFHRRVSTAKSEFIDSMMHELRTPLGTVQVAVEAMKKYGVLSDTVRTQRYLDISHNEISHLSALIDRILQQSIFSSGGMDIKKQAVQVDLLISTAIGRYSAMRDDVSIVFMKTGGAAWVHMDEIHMLQVLNNLLDNAINYSLGEISVKVISVIENSMWILSVSDHGIGIGEAHQKKIFKRFFRVKDPRTDAKGFGLGLSYVDLVVKKHKGTVSLSSSGAGSTFTVSIPVA